jgi:hypothetical protein
MKRATKLWYGLGESVTQASVAAVVGMAVLLPTALYAQSDEGGEGGQAAKPATQHGGEAGEGGEAGASRFPGNLDKAISNIFAGEGGEGGAGLTPMWPSVSAPALTGGDVAKLVTGNTLRTEAHVAWYFTPNKAIEGAFIDWKPTDSKSCPAKEDPKDVFYRGTDGVCYTYKVYPSKGTWSVRNNQLCVNVSWETGKKDDCRYVTILLDNIALFDSNGKIDGKGMKLLKGKALTP